MDLTPHDLRQWEFAHSLRGYNEGEVDELLDRLAFQLERMTEEKRALEVRLRDQMDSQRTQGTVASPAFTAGGDMQAPSGADSSSTPGAEESVSVFDTAAIRAEMEQEKASKDDAYQSCHTYSVAALNSFVRAAQDVNTPVVELDLNSFAAQASGIALGRWPSANEDGRTIARYYSVIRDTSFEVWPAMDGQGLTITLDGQVFLIGKPCSLDDAAAWICRITGSSLDTAKEVFDSALRGKPMSISS